MDRPRSRWPELEIAFADAGRDLQIEVTAPFAIKSRGKEIMLPAFIRNFGSECGMVIIGFDATPEERAAAHANDSFVSELSDGYEKYERELFIDTLNDWGYFGNAKPPQWYSGKPWS